MREVISEDSVAVFKVVELGELRHATGLIGLYDSIESSAVTLK